jgi:EAL domain-containing protein (putative c-di-GMP-specific phosphodiesterase class I)/GGDEF domain-containing protein
VNADSEGRRRHSGLWLLDNLLQEEPDASQDVADALFDAVTHLPTLHLLLTRIHASLRERDQVGLLSVHLSPVVPLEDLFGWETFDEVVRLVAGILDDLKEECLRDGDVLAELSMSGNAFVFVLSPPRYRSTVTYQDLDVLRGRVVDALQEHVAREFSPELAQQFQAHVGCVVVEREHGVDFRRLIVRALDRAYTDGFQQRERERQERARELARVIQQGSIRTVYQPVADVLDEKVLAYEAFSRGPEGPFERPEFMFEIAYEANLLWQLERVCRKRALAGTTGLPSGALLFVNIDPESVFDPELEALTHMTDLHGRVVFEITERAGIKDYPRFRRAVDRLRSVGFRVAIDDVGSAYSGLRLIAEMRPDFVKLDMNITRSMREDDVARELVGTIQRFSDRVSIPLIVEGVETPEDLTLLRSLGVRYVQGYLFARPGPSFTVVDFARVRGQGNGS